MRLKNLLKNIKVKMDLNKIRKVHFVGIGGIGISAIARLMQTKGVAVSGSDKSGSPVTEALISAGAKIFYEHKARNVTRDMGLVVYTIAVDNKNPEIKQAKKYKIPIFSYPQMLGMISKNMFTIAISGTHGKTTTTAMLSKILIDSKLDPTVIVGSILKDVNSNLIVGKSNYFVVEACEYKRSFLNLFPKILVITNVDLDHLDYYKDMRDIQSGFRELALRIPKNGAIICNKNDVRLKPIIKNLKCKIIDYIPYTNIKISLKAPGNHNIQNSAASMSVADFLKINKENTVKSLEKFNGTWRRFDFKGKTKLGAKIYDDYAHHPKEIVATLSGTKEKYPKLKRVAFFQPHLYSRTKLLLNEFANSFVDVDEVYILPIYASREKFDRSINSQTLVKKIKEKGKNTFFVKTFDDAIKCMNKFDQNTVVINIGAGDIYKLSELVVLR